MATSVVSLPYFNNLYLNLNSLYLFFCLFVSYFSTHCTKTKGVREYTPLTCFSQSTGVRGHTTEYSGGYTKGFREANPSSLSSHSGRAHSVYNPGSTHSAPILSTRESTMDSTVSERHIANGRDNLSDHSDFAGRISLFRSNWKALTQEPWVIQTVLEGYHIPLLSAPLQQPPPCNPHLFTEDAAILEEKIQSLLQKQTICQISAPTEGFYLNMFIVQKKDGGQRPVINLKYLNKFVKSEHFKMEGLHTVKVLVLDGQSGPEECLLYGPNSPSISSSPTLQVGGEDISVQLSPL